MADSGNSRIQKFGPCPSLLTPNPTPTPTGGPSLLAGFSRRDRPSDPLTTLVSASKPVVALPNPARDAAKLVFLLGEAGKVRVTLTDLAGNVVRNQDLGDQTAGVSTADLDLRVLSSGLYFVVLQVDDGFGFKAKKPFKLAVVR